MAQELIQRWHALDLQFPNFAKSCMLVSCEQEIEDVTEYVSFGSAEYVPKADKEHVLVCANVKIDGRFGVFLADPGFHVSKIVTVMLDGAYPQSGCIVQLDTPEHRKEYHYNFNKFNAEYVEWHDIRITKNITMQDTSLIYIAKPYIEGVNVTIRRNLVYEFKSIVGRDKDGQITGGIYFRICKNEKKFTIITVDEHQTKKTKYDFASISQGQDLPEALKKELDQVTSVLKLKDGELARILQKVAMIISDDTFVDQMYAINEYIQTYNPAWFQPQI